MNDPNSKAELAGNPGVVSSEMLCLSVRQPWAWLIVQGYKDVENREWRTGVRGPVLIHSGKTMTRADYDACVIFCSGLLCEIGDPFPLFESLRCQLGGIVGETNIRDCVTHHQSQWFCGPYGFVLSDSRPLAFEPLKGALGFFKVERHND